MLRFTTAALTLTIAGSAFAQTADPNLTFDVATVKVAPPPTAVGGGGGGRVMIRIGPSGGPGTADPGQINYSFMNLHQLITTAYSLKSYQVSGPSIIDSERYEITAKVPHGASKEDVKIMLQNLLKERFGLQYHREKKEMSVYALVTGKNGPKMTESADQSDPFAAPPPSTTSADGGPSATAGPPPPPDFKNLKKGPDGLPILPSRPGLSMMMQMGPNGARMKMNAKQATMQQLADSLASQLDKPSVDMTGLSKRYDFVLDFAPDTAAMQNKPGSMMIGPPGGGGGGAMVAGEGHGGGDLAASNPQEGASLFTALQEQLGLKLEAKKAPVDLLIVDGASKNPSEN